MEGMHLGLSREVPVAFGLHLRPPSNPKEIYQLEVYHRKVKRMYL